jgi:hypothetical protein
MPWQVLSTPCRSGPNSPMRPVVMSNSPAILRPIQARIHPPIRVRTAHHTFIHTDGRSTPMMAVGATAWAAQRESSATRRAIDATILRAGHAIAATTTEDWRCRAACCTASVARMSDLSAVARRAKAEAASGAISHAAPHIAIARRETRVTALMAHAGYMLRAHS